MDRFLSAQFSEGQKKVKILNLRGMAVSQSKNKWNEE